VVKGCRLIIEIMLLKDVCKKEGEKAGALSIQVNAFNFSMSSATKFSAHGPRAFFAKVSRCHQGPFMMKHNRARTHTQPICQAEAATHKTLS
jgi:hypothetical protein